MTAWKTIFASILLLAALAGCSGSRRPKAVAERHEDPCAAWLDHLMGLPCLESNPDALSDADREAACAAFSGGPEGSPLADCDFGGFFACVVGQYSCIGDSLAVGGAVLDDASGFAGLMVLFLPFETCMSELDDPQCFPFGQADPCVEVPTTVEGKEWSLTAADPQAMFPSMTEEVMISIDGVGQEVTFASLLAPGMPTDEDCESSAPDVSLIFDGQTLQVNGSIPGGVEDCELTFEGEVADCVEPSAGLAIPGDQEHVLRFEGQGSYHAADGTGGLSTMFLRLSEPSIPPELDSMPCDVPTSLLETEWSLSDTVPLITGFPPRNGPYLRVVGSDETIAFADLAVGIGDAGSPSVCYVDSPNGIFEFDAEGLLLELAYDGEADTSCFIRFEGTFVDCEMITLDELGGDPIYSITVEGAGEFDNGNVFGALETLYLMIQQIPG